MQSNLEQFLLLQPRGPPSNCLRFLAHELEEVDGAGCGGEGGSLSSGIYGGEW